MKREAALQGVVVAAIGNQVMHFAGVLISHDRGVGMVSGCRRKTVRLAHRQSSARIDAHVCARGLASGTARGGAEGEQIRHRCPMLRVLEMPVVLGVRSEE